jgi:seryl-tRNA synthetase
VSYKDHLGNSQTPFGLNCTAITFRTGLAIMEQFQTEDGRVKLPEVLKTKMGKEFLG